jgi:hypothetical protein
MIAKSVNDMFSMQNTPGGQRLAVATIGLFEIFKLYGIVL